MNNNNNIKKAMKWPGPDWWQRPGTPARSGGFQPSGLAKAMLQPPAFKKWQKSVYCLN